MVIIKFQSATGSAISEDDKEKFVFSYLGKKYFFHSFTHKHTHSLSLNAVDGVRWKGFASQYEITPESLPALLLLGIVASHFVVSTPSVLF
jgi:hypothetical protein